LVSSSAAVAELCMCASRKEDGVAKMAWEILANLGNTFILDLRPAEDEPSACCAETKTYAQSCDVPPPLHMASSQTAVLTHLHLLKSILRSDDPQDVLF
jgi:hypothetical protein